MANESVRPNEVDDDAVRTLNQISALLTEIKTKHNALCAKLDADAGVTDTNYAATQNITGAVSDTLSINY